MGIACRQYIVAFPLAFAIHSVLQRIHAKHIVIDGKLAAPTIATASLAGWYLFFGAAGPQR
jgi:hypothetical protein